MRRKKTLEPQLSSCDLKSAAISLPSASDATEAGSTFRGFPLSSARGPRMGQEQGPGGKRRSERKGRLRGKEDRVGARYTPQVRGFPPAPLAPAISFGTSDNSGAREQVAPPDVHLRHTQPAEGQPGLPPYMADFRRSGQADGSTFVHDPCCSIGCASVSGPVTPNGTVSLPRCVARVCALAPGLPEAAAAEMRQTFLSQ